MTKYEEEIYPSELKIDIGAVWVFSAWEPKWNVKSKKSNMPVMIFAWCKECEIVAMSHQSLQ